MKCEVLINFLSDYNDHNIIALLEIKPQKAIFIRLDEEEEIFIELKEFLQEKLPDTEIIERTVDIEDLSAVKDILIEYIDKSTIINLSGGSRVQGIFAREVACRNHIQSIIVDMYTKKIYSINNDKFVQLDEEFIELSIEDILESTGKDILFEATQGMDELIEADILNFITKNFGAWDGIKRMFVNRKQISSYKDLPLTMVVNWKRINRDIGKKLYELMKILEKNRLIYVYDDNRYTMKFRFKNKGIKRYFLASGSWLESLTYKCIKELREIDDIKSGVVFMWDYDAREVKNEIDVIASQDSRLICVSCKDTNHYDQDDLNEINVYSEELGGEDAIKIIVSTKEPHKHTIIKRAEEMDINLIIFNGDIVKFKKDLSLAINKENSFSL